MLASRVLTAWYFLHFIVVLPLLGLLEKPKPLPTSISQAVLGSKKAVAGLAVFLAAAALILGAPSPASAQEHEQAQPPRNSWSFGGVFGRYDPGQLQRGFKVYREVCQVCHGLKLVAFRTLGQEGGPDFTEAEVEAIAAQYKIKDGPNEQGDMFERPGRPADHFPAAVPQRANGAPRQQRLPAAGHVGARQGAPIRARLSLVSSSTSSLPTRNSAPTTSSPC